MGEEKGLDYKVFGKKHNFIYQPIHLAKTNYRCLKEVNEK